MLNKGTKILARTGVIAALYVVISLITLPVAGGAIQIRLSEGLTLLPLFFPESVPALFIGCMLSNLICGCAPLDIVLGSVITLCAGLLTFGVGKLIKSLPLKIIIGGLFPVLFNAFLLPLVWSIYGAGQYVYIVQVGLLAVSQTLTVYGLGTPLSVWVDKGLKSGNALFK